MADVKIPGVGEVPKTAALAGAGIVVVLVIMHYKSAAGGGTGGTSGAAGAYPPDGTTGNPADPNSIDPSTGLTYGSEGIGTGSAPGAYGLSASGGAYSPGYDYSSGSGASGGSGGPPFTDNGAWSQYAETYLSGSVGLDAAHVSAALGAYLAGQQVTPAQKSIIDQAIGVAGNPPVTGPGGYPPSIRLSHSPAHNGTVTVPDVAGMRQVDAVNMLKAAGLHPSYSPPPHGRTFYVTRTRPGAGSHVQRGTLVRLYSEQKQYLPKGIK